MTGILLIIIIYLAFISLGLPDSILGVSVPVLIEEWNIDLSAAGFIAMVVTAGTIVSSFLSGFIIRRLGTAKTNLVSNILTASALLGISLAPAWQWLLLFAVPLGIGAGSVDTALNNYVALNYKAHHMNWLHSFWGIGASLGPLIFSFSLKTSSWRGGYQTIALIQAALIVILIISLPLWRKQDGHGEQSRPGEQSKEKLPGPGLILGQKGAVPAILTMFFYCAAEVSLGLWGSSYLIGSRSMTARGAATVISLYYAGITAGRFISGFASFRLSNRSLIRIGLTLALSAAILLALSGSQAAARLSIIVIGFGLAPVFPSMLHETPKKYGREISQIMIGFQMGAAYLGSAIFPPLTGFVLQQLGTDIMPFIAAAVIAAVLILTEYSAAVSKRTKHLPALSGPEEQDR